MWSFRCAARTFHASSDAISGAANLSLSGRYGYRSTDSPPAVSRRTAATNATTSRCIPILLPSSFFLLYSSFTPDDGHGDVRRVLLRVVHGIPGDDAGLFVVIVAAGIQVAIEARKV